MAVLLSGNAGATALLLAAVAINTRALSLVDFGSLVLLQTFALLIAGVLSFSTQQAVIKLGILSIEAGDKRRFEVIVGMGFLADVIAAAAAAGVAFLSIIAVPLLVALPPAWMDAAFIVALSLLLQGYRTSEGICRIFDRFSLLAWLQFASAALTLAFAAILWLKQAPIAFYGLFVALTVCLPSILQLAAAGIILHLRGYRPRLALDSVRDEDRREFIAYCWTTSLMGTADAVRQNGDAPLVGILVSVEAAGIYNVARQVAGVIRKASAIHASVLFPELISFAARGLLAQARRVLRQALVIISLLGAALVLAAASFGTWALSIVFGSGFAAGGPPLVLLCMAAALQVVSATYSMYVQAYVGPAEVLRAYVPSLLVFLLVIGPAIAYFGLLGAGLAQMAFFAVLAWACRARLYQHPLWSRSSTS
jgi:O-antigen/teichoic acid export membrane protein